MEGRQFLKSIAQDNLAASYQKNEVCYLWFHDSSVLLTSQKQILPELKWACGILGQKLFIFSLES